MNRGGTCIGAHRSRRFAALLAIVALAASACSPAASSAPSSAASAAPSVAPSAPGSAAGERTRRRPQRRVHPEADQQPLLRRREDGRRQGCRQSWAAPSPRSGRALPAEPQASFIQDATTQGVSAIAFRRTTRTRSYRRSPRRMAAGIKVVGYDSARRRTMTSSSTRSTSAASACSWPTGPASSPRAAPARSPSSRRRQPPRTRTRGSN